METKKLGYRFIAIIGILLTLMLIWESMGSLDCFPFIEMILIILFLIFIYPGTYVVFDKFLAIPPNEFQAKSWSKSESKLYLNSISKEVDVIEYKNSGKDKYYVSSSSSRSGNKVTTTTKYRPYEFFAEIYYFEFESEDELNRAEAEIVEHYSGRIYERFRNFAVDTYKYKNELIVYKLKNEKYDEKRDQSELKRLVKSGTVPNSREQAFKNVIKYRSAIHAFSLILILLASLAMAYTFGLNISYLSALVLAIALVAYAISLDKNDMSSAKVSLIVIVIASIIRFASVMTGMESFFKMEYLIPLFAILLIILHFKVYTEVFEEYCNN